MGIENKTDWKKMKNKILVLISILLVNQSLLAFEDPTKGKPFFPWLWEDQFKPTIENSWDTSGVSILAAGALITVGAHQYDEEIYQHNTTKSHKLMNKDTSLALARLGSGAVGIGIALSQVAFDQDNGLMHVRAIALTSASHFLTAFIVQKDRPGGRGDYLPFPSSFPSGHTSSAFATATSLSYAYGWKAGIPAFILASAISASRVNENAHWLSDVTAGAALGIFWGRASYMAEINKKEENNFSWMPVPYQDGVQVNAYWRF